MARARSLTSTWIVNGSGFSLKKRSARCYITRLVQFVPSYKVEQAVYINKYQILPTSGSSSSSSSPWHGITSTPFKHEKLRPGIAKLKRLKKATIHKMHETGTILTLNWRLLVSFTKNNLFNIVNMQKETFSKLLYIATFADQFLVKKGYNSD